MSFPDYYKILGIDKTSDSKAVKNAYRKLARKYHPDLNPNNNEALKNFQRINEANEVLSDPDKRKKYDQYGNDWQHTDHFEAEKKKQRSSQEFRGSGFSESQSADNFSSFFESMFGATAGNRKNSQIKFRGEDYRAELSVDLIEAYQTHKKMITVNGVNIRITIPAGIENGQTIRVTGHGGLGINGGPNGDLLISFSLTEHPKIKRLENNLYTTIDLDLYTAVLGGEVTIETFSGKIKLRVNPETPNNSKVKLNGQGFPVFKKEGQFGDLIVTYSVLLPIHLTEKQKALFVQLSESGGL